MYVVIFNTGEAPLDASAFAAFNPDSNLSQLFPTKRVAHLMRRKLNGVGSKRGTSVKHPKMKAVVARVSDPCVNLNLDSNYVRIDASKVNWSSK